MKLSSEVMLLICALLVCAMVSRAAGAELPCKTMSELKACEECCTEKGFANGNLGWMGNCKCSGKQPTAGEHFWGNFVDRSLI